MRIALMGDFDTYLLRGLERPQELLPYRLSPGSNLLRGFRELGVGVKDIHILVDTPEVKQVAIEEGPLGILHRLPCPRFSGSACFHLWRRHALLRELGRIQPDILHGHGTEAEYAFTAVTSPYPNVITFHGIMHRVQEIVPPPVLSTRHVARWLEKLVARKARHVISLSQEVETFLREQRSPARCHRIPNAVGPWFFEIQPMRRGDGTRVLLFVGTIYPLKGLLELVEALAGLQGMVSQDIVLRVIGPEAGGDYAARVRRRAQELGVDKQIEWLGIRSEHGVSDALARSDIFVLPSFMENMPMCIAEAFAAGVPVVSTTAGGIPNWVEDGKTGLLVAPGDSKELARALGTLLQDESLRNRLGSAGRARALADYYPRVVAAKTLEVYETILREPASRQA